MHGFQIEVWLKKYQAAVTEAFGGRVWFIGIQGSYGRGEATAESDIDAVLILDTVSAEDLRIYSELLDKLPAREMACGFVSGKDELLSWEASDLFQFYYDTTALYGTLSELRGRFGRADIQRAVHLGACNLYHAAVHNFVHEKSAAMLKELYKSAVFSLQAAAYLKTGQYAKKKAELVSLLGKQEREILRIAAELKAEQNIGALSREQFSAYSEKLISWSSERIKREAEEPEEPGETRGSHAVCGEGRETGCGA